MKIRLTATFLCLLLLLTGCNKKDDQNHDLGNSEDNQSFGSSFDDLGAYGGYFEGESTDITITCLSGTQNAYKIEGTTLTFTEIGEESIYSISGNFKGNIVIDVGDDYKFDLEMHGFSLVSNTTNPIMILSGDEISIKAKKDTKNYIYDMRPAIDSADETLYSGMIHSDVDLEISGKGSLTIVSENNNGIHSKDDLQVKNLTLLVACTDNALKGNDSVEITGGNTTLIASAGDGIKTSNSDISEKGNQRGTVTIAGGTHTIYAACDGIDAAYNAVIDDSTTVLNIYTDKYSNYSSEVTATSSSDYYIRCANNAYKYSVKYYNSDSDYTWVNATYHSSVQGGRSTYYYYTFPKNAAYSKMQFFIYSSDMEQSQDSEYLVVSDFLEPNTAYDTFALTSRGNQLTYSWTNYTINIQEDGFGGFGGPGGPGRPGGPGGQGGMNGGNTDKGDYSTKGIKAANEITINAGTINIKSYDDAIHANNDTALENGATPHGNIMVNGGNIILYSNDDVLHADGNLSVNAGTIRVTNSYEGMEGATVNISGGCISVNAKDDGVNATTTTGTAVAISGGTIYIYCNGDGIDSNSRTSYSGIVFSGGNTVVISNSNGNSAIDTEQGYAYKGGAVVAIMPRGGMSNEATHCQSFSSVGKSTQLSLTKNSFLVVEIGDSTATIKIPASMSALVLTLGDNSPNIDTKNSVSVNLDDNGVAWN
jgi:hypothetical protein